MNNAVLILVGGVPGTGKTTFAQALAKAIDAVHLNSDIVRDSLGWRGKYDLVSKTAVYDEMMEKAKNCLSSGRKVIVDATFYKNKLRRIYWELAQNESVDSFYIELEADEKTIRERVGKVRKYSEANFDVYQKIKAEYEPLTLPHLTLWTDRMPLDEMVEKGKSYLMKNLKSDT